MTDLLDDRQTLVGHVITNYSGAATAFYPGEEVQPPEPSGDIGSPTRYWMMEVNYDSVERSDFDGGEIRKGELGFSIWIERCGSDQHLIDTADEIITALAVSGLSNDYHVDTKRRILRDSATDGPWEGRFLSVPFWAGLSG